MSLTMHGDLRGALERRHRTCAVIAIKERARCKTRLAQSLPGSARLELVRTMLAGVLAAARSARTVHQTIVVSPERDEIPAEIPVLADSGECLNSALAQAHGLLRELGCREVVVLPADLPGITAAEIDALVRDGRAAGCAIAPDEAGSGTNALCLVGMQPFDFQFGPDSQRLHLQEAQRLGLTPRIVRLPGLALDVDSPADLEILGQRQWLRRLRA